jgi:hypothetical protein
MKIAQLRQPRRIRRSRAAGERSDVALRECPHTTRDALD